MKEWHSTLPPEVVDMLSLSPQELSDFSGATARMEALSRLSFRRAVKSVTEQDQMEAASQWGDGQGPDEDVMNPELRQRREEFRENRVQRRMALAISAHKELVKMKYNRLDALDKFEKAQDLPQEANIVFEVKMPSPQQAVQRLVNMGRLVDAKKQAKVLGIEHEFNWEGVAEPETQGG